MYYLSERHVTSTKAPKIDQDEVNILPESLYDTDSNAREEQE